MLHNKIPYAELTCEADKEHTEHAYFTIMLNSTRQIKLIVSEVNVLCRAYIAYSAL